MVRFFGSGSIVVMAASPQLVLNFIPVSPELSKCSFNNKQIASKFKDIAGLSQSLQFMRNVFHDIKPKCRFLLLMHVKFVRSI